MVMIGVTRQSVIAIPMNISNAQVDSARINLTIAMEVKMKHFRPYFGN